MSKKKSVQAEPMFDSHDDPFALSPELKKEIHEQDLEYKWINAVLFTKNHGYNRQGYRPYKPKAQAEGVSSQEQIFGRDPEGFVRRNDSILAVKPAAAVHQARAKISERNRKIKESLNKAAADQLRSSAPSDSKVFEGYDEND